MKKQKIQILILLVLCIVCVGGYFIIRNHTFETEEETVSVDVTNFNKDDVTELILSGDHEVHLVKSDDVWTENSLPDETIKESTVNTLLMKSPTSRRRKLLWSSRRTFPVRTGGAFPDDHGSPFRWNTGCDLCRK